MAKDKKKSSKTAETSAVEEKSTKLAKEKTKDKDTKPAKKDKSGKKPEEKKNVFKSIGKWFHDLKVEFKNVTWPSRDTVVINTSVVLFVVVAGSALIGLIDLGLLKLMEFLIGLSQ